MLTVISSRHCDHIPLQQQATPTAAGTRAALGHPGAHAVARGAWYIVDASGAGAVGVVR